MFRIRKDDHMDFYYVHKKFLWWWVKWGCPKSNMVQEINNLYLHIKKGEYNFSTGEYGNYYFIEDRGYYTEMYVNNADELKDKYPEYFI